MPDDRFEAFLDVYLDGLVRLARVLTTNRESAEDLSQQTVLRLMERWHRVRDAHDPGAYARRVMLNEFLGQQRKTHVDVRIHSRPDRRASSSDRVDSLMAADAMLRALPERQRAALALRYLEDRPDAYIAGVLGCRQSTVRSLVKRGLDELRRRESAATPKESLNEHHR